MDKIDLVVDKIDTNHKHVEHRLDRIDANLAEHMRRTDILEQLHIDNQKRIELLEEPKKVVSLLKKWIIGIGAVSGAVLTIAKLLKYL